MSATTPEPDTRNYDVVAYDSGTRYIVFGPSAGRLFVKGFRNGKPFGACRYIAANRCTKIGTATRPQTSRDAWTFTATEGK